MSILHHYQVLNLTPHASRKEVEEAYHDLLRIWDPERFPTDKTLREEVAKRRKEIETAYQAILAWEQGKDGLNTDEASISAQPFSAEDVKGEIKGEEEEKKSTLMTILSVVGELALTVGYFFLLARFFLIFFILYILAAIIFVPKDPR